MSCKPICQLCDKIRISQAITFSNGTLIINLPAGNYEDCGKYCIVLAQSIPSTTTINSPVVVTVGDGTQQYPLTNCNCSPVTACSLRTRTRYSVCVSTTATGGTFRLIGKPCCAPKNQLQSINGTVPATPAVATASVETSVKGVK